MTARQGLGVDLVDTGSDLIEFNTVNPDSNGVYWFVTTLEGWEAPEPRQKTIDKAGDHGQILAESYYNSRSLVLDGVIKIPATDTDSSLYWGAWNWFISVLSHDIVGGENFTKLTVYEAAPKYVLCKLAGKPKWTIHPGYWQFQVNLTAVDPRKYLVGGGGPGSSDWTW